MSGVIDPTAEDVGLMTTREELPKRSISCGTAQRMKAFDGATGDDQTATCLTHQHDGSDQPWHNDAFAILIFFGTLPPI